MPSTTTESALTNDTKLTNVFSDSFALSDGLAESPSDTGKLPGWSSDVIPEQHSSRTLILAFDGTGDQFDADNSNIVQLVYMLKKDDQREQMVYYQSGIGTYINHKATSIWTPISQKISKVMDEAVAWDLSSHTKGGYEFLMENYHAGDKICIFGFSRGAYTARSVAGMLTKVGLLPPGNREQVKFAYKMYAREDEVGWKQSVEFKKTFCVDVEVEFLGVFDTVNSVGLVPHRLPFTVSNSSIRYFRHAVSLDERRAKFKANLWPPEKMESRFTDMLAKNQGKKNRKKDGDLTLMQLERQFSDASRPTDIYEVWFMGCHCDVGGGAVPNGTRNALARIPLRWMIRQCFLANTGIMFHAERLKTIGIDPDSLYPLVKPRPPPLTIEKLDRSRVASEFNGNLTLVNPGEYKFTEEEEDLADALSPIHDQLKLAKPWWILEVLPMKQRIQQRDGTWEWQLSSNMGKARYFPQGEEYPVHLHRTVKTRMESKLDSSGSKPYTPKASPLRGEPLWVD
jgi:uncharacterized protein (DUF2235 family)